MFERFTDRARRVLLFSQEEARHILLGLIREAEGVAAKALDSLDISLDVVRQQVEEIIGRGEDLPTGHIPFTPRAKKVFELSLRESLQLGHNYIGTEHILLSLIREGEGVGAQILQRLGADMNRVRQTVMRRLADHVAGTEDMSRETASQPSEPVSPFEEREKTVLGLLTKGLTATEIADVLGVPRTKVNEIVQGIVAKLRKILRE